MNIMDIFKTKATSAPQVNNSRPEPPMQQHQPGADPNVIANQPEGTSANGPAKPTDPPKSPLDEFKDIWQAPTTKDGQQPVDPLSQPLLTTDPTKLAEAARKMNFAAGIDPAKVQKALGGDAQALLEVINHAGQNAFLASSQLSTQVTEGAVKTNNDRLGGSMEAKFREFLVMNERVADNPVLNHPAAAGMLDMAKRQLLSQHPTKSPGEINAMAQKFLTDFASTLTTQQTNQQSGGSERRDPTDFSNWI